MAKGSIKTGDKVSWGASQGKVTGKVVKKQTSPTKIKGHKVAASNIRPAIHRQERQDRSEAAHKAGALKKAKA